MLIIALTHERLVILNYNLHYSPGT